MADKNPPQQNSRRRNSALAIRQAPRRIAVMQPYFFPYVGQFELMNRVDKWLVLDTVQYIRRGWMNRNRILQSSEQGWQYISAPVQKQSQDTLIRDVKVVEDPGWKSLIIKQLQHYKKAPYYDATLELVSLALEPNDLSLARLNVNGLKLFSRYLGIEFDYEFCSHLDVQIAIEHGPDEWPLQVAKALGAKEYLNPPGGVGIYDAAKFAAHGIELTIQPFVDFRYPCGRFQFEPALSIIDVCMWNPPEQIKAFLDSYNYEARAA